MKKTICFLITLTVLLTTFTMPVYAEEEIKVSIDGEFVEFTDMKPVIVNGRTLVPVRAIFEKMGLEVGWNEELRIVTGKKDGLEIRLPIDNKYANKNGEEIELNVPASIIKGRTMVPVRFISESVGAEVDWDSINKTVIITYNPIDTLYNDVIKLGDKVTVAINYNYELALVAAALGSDFQHKRYLSESYKTLRNEAKDYFGKYINSESTKDIFNLCEQNTSIRFFGNNIYHKIINSNLYKNIVDLNWNYSDQYNSPESTLEILNRLKRFNNETDAIKFFQANENIYKNMIENYRNNYNFNHIERIEDFFGYDLEDEFVIYLSCTTSGGRSSNITNYSGNKVHINIVNNHEGSSKSSFLNVLYHEAVHDFLRRYTKENPEEINKYSSYVTALYDDNYNGYSTDFMYLLDESITKAITGIMLETYHGKEMAKNMINYEVENNGCKGVDKLYEFIKSNYITNKDSYSTFGEFMPQILEYIKELCGEPLV